MASVRLLWADGSDIHVLKNEKSPTLISRLIVEDDSIPPKRESAAIASDIDPTTFTFTPNFRSQTTPPDPPTHASIEVNTATGEVTVPPSLSAPPRLRSFVLEATVKTKPPNATTLGPLPIRVCVHNAITDFWLTPNPLTVRLFAGQSHLTVLARFDDDTVGDITGRPGITWSSVPAAIITVKADGRLEAQTGSGEAVISARHAGKTRKAKVRAEDPWGPAVAATLVPGSAGVAKMAGVPNFLFLPDGFKAEEKKEFKALVQAIVNQLHSTDGFPPYGDLKGVANYFMAFVPSPDRGTSVLYEMELEGRKKPVGRAIPDPVKKLIALSNFTLANLIWEVGLPTPADAAVSHASAVANWGLQYRRRFSTLTQAVYQQWQRLLGPQHDGYRLANERDTAFGLRHGQRPAMERISDHEIRFNSRRTRWDELRPMFGNLRLKTTTGPKIGAIWTEQNTIAPMDPPSDPKLPAGLTVGQDSGRVCFLLGGACGGRALDGVDEAMQVAQAIASSLTKRPVVPFKEVTVAGNKQVELVPLDLPSTPDLDAVATVAHQLTHAFVLLDEYGFPDAPLTIPTARISEVRAKGRNVIEAERVTISPSDENLDASKLRFGLVPWLWPRIDAAGVFMAVPDRDDTNPSLIDIRLQKGQAKQFEPFNLVRLRKRRQLVRNLFSFQTPLLTVDAVLGDIVTVREAQPGDLPISEFLQGGVLFRPVRGKPTASDPDGPDLPLIAPIILDRLKSSKRPLNRAADAALCVKDEALIQTPRNLPAIPRDLLPLRMADIVGLYDGGASFFCGVYHPSGACLMRAPKDPSFGTYRLCHVCRYVVVDHVDPTKLKKIDGDYEANRRYPQP
jgi:hypothetical protein